ncbi:MAG TPA: sulfatase-like hydrolase/transferase, partial [Kofleriaceae bacterium]|nr:sulfatase-like hydrolase/transferase [Kofleriaceae bacterium]
QGKQHEGLAIAVAMTAAVGALLVATLLTFALGRALELGLRALANRTALGRALSSPWAPAIAAGALVSIAAVIAIGLTWEETLRLLPLRPLWITLLFLGLAAPAIRAGDRIACALERRRPLVRRAMLLAAVLAVASAVLWFGERASVRKAADRYSGLGGPLTRVYQVLGDFDRDGYSRILGGGDCDDWDASIHPNAVDVPDDGIDQNCIGGDATLNPAPNDPAFAPVPEALPADFNVVLITIDTLRSDHVSAYGYARKTTPRIDEVVADGTLFRNAWAHAPSTRYSIPAILTGRLPLDVRYEHVPGGWPGISTDNTTIAEVLRAQGLVGGAVLNYSYFDPKRNFGQGFTFYDNRNARLHTATRDGPAKTRGSSSKEQTDVALEFLDQRRDGRFFLWVHYYDPHLEYEKHPGFDFGDGRRDLYDSEIAYTDHHIGRLLDELRRRGVYDKTVVVITSDHGEGFGEHGIDLHGYHLYAAQTRVPLIVRVPGTTPRVVDTPAGHTDILPTLANLAGAAPSEDMMGRSLVDLIAGAAELDRYVFQQLSFENNNEMRAAAGRRCHVIFNVSPVTSWELYRIASDPAEKRDIIDDPGDCAEARTALETWYDQAQLPRSAPTPRPPRENPDAALLPGKPELDAPLDVDLGDAVRLLAVEVPDAPVRAGQSFEVTYTFEARGTLSDRGGAWKVFAHFARPENFFTGDHAPPRPFATWKAGQYIRYQRTVRVPAETPAGPHVVWVGLFRGGDRQPARGAGAPIVDDKVRVGQIMVTR